MKNRFQYRGKGATASKRTCTTAMRHPYLRHDFWTNPSNQFWNSGMYSEESKQYLKEHITI
jgi:hypothetical protein